MNVTETLNEGLKRGFEITITSAELDDKVDAKLTEAQPEIEMKGFRKGKVPMPLLKKQFGQRVMGEVIQESVDGALQEHLGNTGDRPAAQPELKVVNEDWSDGDDIVVALSYEKLPDVPEIDYKALKLERLVVKPEAKEVDEALGNLAENAQNFETKKGKAASGDQVVFDFVGSVDGEEFEGGAAEDFPLVLGSGQFIPGFEEQLEGVKAGEEKSVEVSFPDGYQAEHLAGKAAVFACKIKEVKKPAKAEIDDELAKKFGAEDLAALKGQIEERLAGEYAGAARQVLKRSLLDQLDSQVKFELPPSLVEAEAGQIAHQLWHEENPDVQGHDHPEIETTDEHTGLAERRVRLGLLLAELGQKNDVEVSDAEFTQAVMTQARQYPGNEREFFEFVQKNGAIQQQIRAPLFEDKVVDFIFEMAEVKEKTVKKGTLEKAVKALEEEA
ncbi:MAG: trigger factor [Pseudomonadota bacterium]